MSENHDITRPLIKAIRSLPGCRAHRLHSGGVDVRGGFMQLEPIGTPDVLALLRHREGYIVPVYFETKSTNGVVSVEQKKEHIELRRLGFRVVVPRSFPEAFAVVKEVVEGRAAK